MTPSRICVKNLPKECQEKQLAQHFKQFGPFTDVKLMRTTNGVSRGFGFIGFVDAANAMEAIQHFDRSFIGTRRMTVELARKVGDASLSKPWSKYSKGSSGYRTLHPEKSDPVNNDPPLAKHRTEAVDSDLQLEEFLQLTMSSGAQKRKKETAQPASEREEIDGHSEKRQRDGGEVVADTKDVHEEERRRLFVRNLSYACTETDLVELFGPYGEIREAHIAVDAATNKSKGFAFVEFTDSTSASLSLNELDGSIFQGRLLHVLPSFEKRLKLATKKSDHRSETDATSSYKKAKEVQLKEEVGNRAAWNTFYIRPDAITDAVADLYDISKSALMNRDASDLGVRLALGETQILAKTKEGLEEAGVDVSVLEEAARASGKAAATKSVPRHDDCLILKNLPYQANGEELREMFTEFGEITKFVMPITRVIVIVQYHKASDAQTAFRRLAYKKYKAVPLYLEWAPLNVFTALAPPQNDVSDGSASDDDEKAAGVTLHVKNLSFSTTDRALMKHFDAVASEVGGQLRSARAARKTHKNGTIVSAGYGFIEVDCEKVVKHILRRLQNSVLDGHLLQLSRSHRRSEVAAPPPSDPRPEEQDAISKLVIKNLAFECTRKDLVQLFSPYGQVESCRLPRKFDGQHRGFAFMDFVTKKEARRAMDSVKGTHLYGRRLVIEFAKTDDAT